MSRTCRIGIHGRNDLHFHSPDYRVIQEANIEAVKMMSQTDIEHFRRLKQIKPDIELITRLYDDRFGRHGTPSPAQFAERMIPVMRRLQPYTTRFEIHNEPNHLDRIEGWGDSDQDARNFNRWYQQVFTILKSQCPWALLGFPGLAIPHRDLEWIEWCRPAVEMSDWLGVHCYWQTPTHEMHNHLSDFWGLRFKYYHQKFPDKIIDLTEVGNSNIQSGLPFTEESHAREYTEYLTECFRYPYLNSACFFIISSPDPTWDGFVWRSRDGQPHKVVWAVRDMRRPHWTAARPRATDSGRVTRAAVQQAQTTRSQNEALQNRMQQLEAQNVRLQAQLATQTQPQRKQIGVFKQISPAPKVKAPQIQNIVRQLPRDLKRLTRRSTNQITRIVVHHTAAPPTMGAARIATYLVNQRGLPAIHYHYFITATGEIQLTNDLITVTRQSSAQINPTALGIGFAGNFTHQPPPAAQIDAGAHLIAWLIQQLKLSPQAVYGNKELISTQSPGAQWDSGRRWGQQLRQRIRAYLQGNVR